MLRALLSLQRTTRRLALQCTHEARRAAVNLWCLLNEWLQARLRPPADRRSLPVLCFGDSLTEGYYGVWTHPEYGAANVDDELGGLRFRPYAVRLGAKLAADAGDGADGYSAALRYAEARAYSGWTAEELRPKLRAALREGGAGPRWRAVAVLAGTNDIVHGVGTAETLARVAALHREADLAGVPLIVVINPDADLKHHSDVKADEVTIRQQELSGLAAGLTSAARREQRAVADARAALPLCAELYDDAVHPSPDGYDKLADVVYAAIHRHRL